jgi:UDP-N-acetylglucosamine 2-epimerase (non-hydrolysing)
MMVPSRVLLVFGTRPEAIKMAPVALALRARPEFDVRICVTAQHRQMLDQVLGLFGIVPDFDLNVMKPSQTLAQLTQDVLSGITAVLTEWRPDVVLVHGDTTTTFAASLACFYQKVAVGHVEAGLRTGNLQSPWPEEANRVLTGVLATHHFAPTPAARDNLLKAGVSSARIHMTGNTVIDALLDVVRRLEADEALCQQLDARLPRLSAERRLVLVTGHRRENFGQGFENICEGLRRLADRPDVEIVYPAHLNPNVQQPVRRLLGAHPRIHLVEPLEYLPFVRLMMRSYLILTDSGGIQEEAPSLNKPVLLMRDTTERPEALQAGVVRMVGCSAFKIVSEASVLLDEPLLYERMMSKSNPYGDGRAAERIVDTLVAELCGPTARVPGRAAAKAR